MNEDTIRQQALNLIQTVDVASVLGVVRQIADAVRPLRPDLPSLDVDAAFLKQRKELLHRELEDIERTNPALAAQLQQVIDKYCTQFPFDYE
jgi:hypothetical protein